MEIKTVSKLVYLILSAAQPGPPPLPTKAPGPGPGARAPGAQREGSPVCHPWAGATEFGKVRPDADSCSFVG